MMPPNEKDGLRLLPVPTSERLDEALETPSSPNEDETEHNAPFGVGEDEECAEGGRGNLMITVTPGAVSVPGNVHTDEGSEALEDNRALDGNAEGGVSVSLTEGDADMALALQRVGAFPAPGWNELVPGWNRSGNEALNSRRREPAPEDSALPAILAEDSRHWVMHTLLRQRAPVTNAAVVNLEPPVVDGRPVRSNNWKNNPFTLALVAFSAGAIIVASSAAVITANRSNRKPLNDGKESQSHHGQPGATFDKFEALKKTVSFISDENALSDSTMPQFRALSWMAHEDKLNFSFSGDESEAIIQRYIMVLLYFSTGGDTWAGTNQTDHNYHGDCPTWKALCWKSFKGIEMERSDGDQYLSPTSHECNWEGVGCYEGSDTVAAITFVNNNMSGTIPNEISTLALEVLYLSHSPIVGTIPESIYDMPSLRVLDLYANRLAGTIPQRIGNATSLGWISLAQNLLTGTIPPSMGKLSQLSVVVLWANQLSGTLPFDYQKMRMVRFLDVSYNGLTGSIPSTIGQMYDCIWFGADRNFLTGMIPASFGNLTRMKRLGLSGNQLSGSIPASISDMEDLRMIHLSHNLLNETIPQAVKEISSLNIVALDHNFLSGTIPSGMEQLPELRLLGLNFNHLTGTIPEGLGNSGSITHLWLNDNKLTGPLGAIFTNATGLGDVGFICDYNTTLLTGPEQSKDEERACKCCTTCTGDDSEGNFCDPQAHQEFLFSVFYWIIRKIWQTI